MLLAGLTRIPGELPTMSNNTFAQLIFRLLLPLHYPLAKRHQRYFHHLKMLAGKGNADDSKEQQDAKNDVGQGNPDAATKNPDNIKQQADAAGSLRGAYHLLAKRPECKHPQLKTLQPERNANDSEAKYQATSQIAQRSKESAENQPDDIA